MSLPKLPTLGEEIKQDIASERKARETKNTGLPSLSDLPELPDFPEVSNDEVFDKPAVDEFPEFPEFPELTDEEILDEPVQKDLEEDLEEDYSNEFSIFPQYDESEEDLEGDAEEIEENFGFLPGVPMREENDFNLGEDVELESGLDSEDSLDDKAKEIFDNIKEKAKGIFKKPAKSPKKPKMSKDKKSKVNLVSLIPTLIISIIIGAAVGGILFHSRGFKTLDNIVVNYNKSEELKFTLSDFNYDDNLFFTIENKANMSSDILINFEIKEKAKIPFTEKKILVTSDIINMELGDTKQSKLSVLGLHADKEYKIAIDVVELP